MKKQKYILFFYIPLLGFMVIFFAFSSLNRGYIKDKVEKLVDEQLQAGGFSCSQAFEPGGSLGEDARGPGQWGC